VVGADGKADAFGSVEVAEVAIVHEACAFRGLDVDEMDVVFACHAFPVDVALVVGYVDTLLLADGMPDDGAQFGRAGQTVVGQGCRGEGIGFGQSVDGFHGFTLLLVGRNAGCADEKGA